MANLEPTTQQLKDSSVAFFTNGQFAITISRRGIQDPHAMISFWTLSDETWVDDIGSMSAAWLSEFIELQEKAARWLQRNTKKDKMGGYILKG